MASKPSVRTVAVCYLWDICFLYPDVYLSVGETAAWNPFDLLNGMPRFTLNLDCATDWLMVVHWRFRCERTCRTCSSTCHRSLVDSRSQPPTLANTRYRVRAVGGGSHSAACRCWQCTRRTTMPGAVLCQSSQAGCAGTNCRVLATAVEDAIPTTHRTTRPLQRVAGIRAPKHH
jgi:hypothetical protein